MTGASRRRGSISRRKMREPTLPEPIPSRSATQGQEAPGRAAGQTSGTPPTEDALVPSVSSQDSPTASTIPADSRGKRIGILIVAYNAVTTLAHVLNRIPEAVWSNVEEVVVFDDA